MRKATLLLALACAVGISIPAEGQPLPTFASTIGGSNIDQAWSVASDAAGNSWIAGLTYSADFPCTGSFHGGGTDAFVAKFSPQGALSWCVVLGGSSSDGTVPGQTPAVAIDSTGSAWVTGSTFSLDFPVTAGGTACGANADIFVSKLDPTGTLLFSSCFGGSTGDGGSGIAVDALNNAWITGFVGTSHLTDAFVLGLSSTGTVLNWITFGGSNDDRGVGIAVAPSGVVYVAGVTNSIDFSTNDGSSCATDSFGACYDGFVRAFYPAPDGSLNVLFSTVVGTSANDEVRSLSIDPAGNSYIGGYTWTFEQPEHGFVASFTPAGVRRYLTTLAGESRDWVNSVGADARGNLWVAGYSASYTLFPYHPPTLGRSFLTRLNTSGTGFWCTQRMQPEVVGGLSAGPSDSVYMSGIASGVSGSADAWLSRITEAEAPQIAVTLTPNLLDGVNHKLEEITANVTVSDYCDPDPKVVLLSIVSNEPDNGTGDGDKPNDIQEAALGTDDRQFKLRAERSGSGSGRIYTVTYRATDSAGNYADRAATVTVRGK